MAFSVDVNPAVLRWARESSGFSVPYIAERFGRSEKVVAGWESGRPQPTWTDLCRLAKLYRRPIASLLLPAPPDESPLPADYRTLPDGKKALSPRSRLVIRTVRWLSGRLRELREQLGRQSRFSRMGLRLSDDAEEVGRRVRERFGIAIDEQTRWQTANDALRAWRTATERQGIFVFQFRMPIDEIRGFSLLEEQTPIIVLNETDAVAARIFTLFHEYAHLGMAEPGVCLPEEGPGDAVGSIETFCNRFSAAFLVPSRDLEQNRPTAVRDRTIEDLVRRYRVSRYACWVECDRLGSYRTTRTGAFLSAGGQTKARSDGPRGRGKADQIGRRSVSMREGVLLFPS